MNKATLIAISGVCGAVALGCMVLAPLAWWLMLVLGVVASVAVAIPVMLDVKNLVYSLLTYLVVGALGIFLGLANIFYVAPIVVFCIPFAIVKVYGETVIVSAQIDGEQVLEDPFDIGDDKKVVSVKVERKPKLPKVVKWILFYVLLELGIGLTLLATYLVTPSFFDVLYGSSAFWWIVGVLQLAVFPYNALMNGCLFGTAKALKKVVKPQ